MESAFVAVQIFLLVFLLVHDWIPLGPFNDVAGVKRQHAAGELRRATLINSAPIAVTLGLSLAFSRSAYPVWVKMVLVGILSALFAGELLAWWIPYLAGTSPARVARYAAMFGKTHAFLPARHGITPNTAHVVLHAATAIALLMALWLSFAT